jgi:prolyl-tRNA synthetase
VVTHYRLKADPNNAGKLIVDPNARLEEELVVRPTSEAIIWSTYKNWIQSYRDLPILINQWANVVRWEMRTRLFLRTAEFLWQEGHTAHASKQEAIEETEKMLEVYARFAEEYMALPVIRGVKTANERFAGAEDTYCIEALMQDGKALQAGTSHFLGQNFAKAFDVKFSDKDNSMEYVWATSWGVSTRLIGALVMAHSDDQGLVLPPKIAPLQVVIVPIPVKDPEGKARIDSKANEIMNELKAKGISVKYDNDDTTRPGWKFAEYELKGVPVRIALGLRDLDNNVVEVARRDTKEKSSVSLEGLFENIVQLLTDIQNNLYNRALAFRNENTVKADTWDEFVAILDGKGGFVSAHWDGTPETEEKIKDLTKATIRCIPLNNAVEDGKCILTGAPSKQRVLFARAY